VFIGGLRILVGGWEWKGDEGAVVGTDGPALRSHRFARRLGTLGRMGPGDLPGRRGPPNGSERGSF